MTRISLLHHVYVHWGCHSRHWFEKLQLFSKSTPWDKMQEIKKSMVQEGHREKQRAVWLAVGLTFLP